MSDGSRRANLSRVLDRFRDFRSAVRKERRFRDFRSAVRKQRKAFLRDIK
jgi:hypothetical protein